MSILNVIKVAAIAVVVVKVAQLSYNFGKGYGEVTNLLNFLQRKGFNMNDLCALSMDELKELAEQQA